MSRARKTNPNRFPDTRAGRIAIYCVLAGAMIIAFHSGVQALFPLANDVGPSGDDWGSYHRFAVSVLNGGMSMPAVQGPYTRPGGFGYVYFVAAVYKFFGVRSEAVYLVQTFLLALSVLGFVHAFRRRLTPFYLLAYGLLVIVFAYLDHFRFYTFRLLSENLLIFLLAPLFIAFERLLSRGSRLAAAATGLLAGACFLVRPNTLFLAPAWALLLLYRKRDRRTITNGAILIAGVVLMAGLILWRNYAVTATFDLRMLTTRMDWVHPSSISDAFPFYARRILYLLGYLHGLVPEFGSLRHWYAAWAGVLLLVGWCLRNRQIDDLDLAAFVFLAAYYGPLIAVADITNYGIRHLTPGMPVILYLAVRGAMLTLSRRKHLGIKDE
jgi:4-amino-4-deoxy-L-arabinose transferase-like glycosyltransferase